MTKSSFDTPSPCLPAQPTARRPTMQTPLQPGPKVIFCVRGAISPILANVYLHYVFDLWAHRWRLTKASGDMIVIRYADDTIAGFQHEHEARAFSITKKQVYEAYKAVKSNAGSAGVDGQTIEQFDSDLRNN